MGSKNMIYFNGINCDSSIVAHGELATPKSPQLSLGWNLCSLPCFLGADPQHLVGLVQGEFEAATCQSHPQDFGNPEVNWMQN